MHTSAVPILLLQYDWQLLKAVCKQRSKGSTLYNYISLSGRCNCLVLHQTVYVVSKQFSQRQTLL